MDDCEVGYVGSAWHAMSITNHVITQLKADDLNVEDLIAYLSEMQKHHSSVIEVVTKVAGGEFSLNAAKAAHEAATALAQQREEARKERPPISQKRKISTSSASSCSLDIGSNEAQLQRTDQGTQTDAYI
jgi:hypothetical protein